MVCDQVLHIQSHAVLVKLFQWSKHESASTEHDKLIMTWLCTEPLATAGARCASIAALAPALWDCSSDASRPAGRAMADTRVDLPRLCDRLNCLSGPNGSDRWVFRNRFPARNRPSRTADNLSVPTGVTAIPLCGKSQNPGQYNCACVGIRMVSQREPG
jgi:hypothetical protein